MVLRWLDAALADLRAIKAYIAEESQKLRGGLLPAYAVRQAF